MARYICRAICVVALRRSSSKLKSFSYTKNEKKNIINWSVSPVLISKKCFNALCTSKNVINHFNPLLPFHNSLSPFDKHSTSKNSCQRNEKDSEQQREPFFPPETTDKLMFVLLTWWALTFPPSYTDFSNGKQQSEGGATERVQEEKFSPGQLLRMSRGQRQQSAYMNTIKFW